MSKQLKLMILVNVVLGLLYVVSNFIFGYFANLPSIIAQWSPLWLTFYNYDYIAEFGGEIVAPIPNFSFYFFWVSIAVNLYFIVKLGRSKETKQNST